MPTGEWIEEGPSAPPPAWITCPNCQDIYSSEGGHHCQAAASGNPTSDVGRVPTDVGSHWELAPLAAPGHLGTREDIQNELNGIAASIRHFHVKPPDMVMRETAAYSARLTELTVLLHRVESTDRQYTRVRTQQVQRYLEELDRQFKVASRLLEAQRQDLELLRG